MSRYARISRTRKRNKARIMRIQASIATVTLGLFLSLFVAVSAVALTAYSWLYDLPDYNEVSAFDTSQPTRIYAQDGTLIARLFLENREPVEMDAISPYVLQAIVAVEDERFFEHEGIDPQGIARAAVMTALGSREGGSTITQQYVRQTILRDEAQDMTVRRKVREAYLALEVEQHFTKDEILTMYLNTVYFGEGAHGIQIASLTYFGKNASELTLGEATILAGIPQRPNALNPYRNPDLTLQRRAHVLNRMYENNMITYEERREAEEEELELSRVESPDQGIYDAHYFVAHVRRELHRRFSQADVFGGGLVVHTTIDLDLQRAAETAVWDVIGRDPDGPEGALISQDTDTGKVIAMVGGRNYARSNFNMATQAHRHAGSSFKTFCLVAAIEEGMSPSFRISSSSPASIDTGGGSTWVVNNV
ncbi:MAG: penicillin-binding protein, partial [Coriobacteriia bacterium]|nr:penicillin-binding protein [Coriobacteriia bacterium]